MGRKVTKDKRKAGQAVTVATSNTALYVRVSTQLQAEEGFSLAAQQERLTAYCTAQGWQVCEGHIYVDAGVSGKSTERPQFQAMLEAAKAGQVQRIVAMKLDRVARNVREFLATVDQLKAWRCDLVLVKESFDTGTPHGRFALTMFAAMAELEASTITERMMSGKTQKASKGGFCGAPEAFGYSYNGNEFVINEEEAATVRTIFTLFLKGQSLNSIARTLNAQGAPTKTGKQWFPMTVRQTLTNGHLAGLAQWNGTEVENVYPAIISSDVYEQAHRRLEALRPGIQSQGLIEQRLHAA